MSRRASVLFAICLQLLVLIGCGDDPPEKEMQQAQGALDAARAAGADKYAVDEYGAAQLALAHAREAVAQRDYRLALNHALDSRERAQNSAAQAADGLAAARVEADRALTAADAALAAADARLRAAEAAKVADKLLAEPRGTIDTAHTGVQEARALFENGSYLDVPDSVRAATAPLADAVRAIEAASAPPPRRRR
ncbi:MAG: hypothetical protein AB7Q29_18985 [Vicinamibacterales bacterium]